MINAKMYMVAKLVMLTLYSMVKFYVCFFLNSIYIKVDLIEENAHHESKINFKLTYKKEAFLL